MSKFYFQTETRFDGTHRHWTVALMTGDTVVAQEHGIESSETGFPNGQSLTEMIIQKAHRDLTELRLKVDPEYRREIIK